MHVHHPVVLAMPWMHAPARHSDPPSREDCSSGFCCEPSESSPPRYELPSHGLVVGLKSSLDQLRNNYLTIDKYEHNRLSKKQAFKITIPSRYGCI